MNLKMVQPKAECLHDEQYMRKGENDSLECIRCGYKISMEKIDKLIPIDNIIDNNDELADSVENVIDALQVIKIYNRNNEDIAEIISAIEVLEHLTIYMKQSAEEFRKRFAAIANPMQLFDTLGNMMSGLKEEKVQ